MQYRAHRPILKEGEPAAHVACLLSGAVRLFHRRGGGEILVRLLRAPAIFGETEVIAEIPVMLNASTLELSTILWVPAPLFRELVRTQPKFAQLLAVDLSRVLCLTSAHQRALAFNDLETRLAGLLLDYAELSGRQVEDGVRIDLPLSQEHMARDLGVSRKAVTRALTRLREQGFVAKINARYVVRDSEPPPARDARAAGLVHRTRS